MSECEINAREGGRPAKYPCERCGEGLCHVWRHDSPRKIDSAPDPDPGAGMDDPPIPSEPRPDPAYAAALSETSIMIDARARAVDLAIKAFGPLPHGEPTALDHLFGVSNRFYAYLVSGK